jgi:hypothetical protein
MTEYPKREKIETTMGGRKVTCYLLTDKDDLYCTDCYGKAEVIVVEEDGSIFAHCRHCDIGG